MVYYICGFFSPRVGCADQHVSGMAFLPEECWLKLFLSCLKKKLQVGESSCDYTHGVLKKKNVHIAQKKRSQLLEGEMLELIVFMTGVAF